jgi:hypothetical protein
MGHGMALCESADSSLGDSEVTPWNKHNEFHSYYFRVQTRPLSFYTNLLVAE